MSSGTKIVSLARDRLDRRAGGDPAEQRQLDRPHGDLGRHELEGAAAVPVPLDEALLLEVGQVLVDGGERAQAEVLGGLLDGGRVALALDVPVQEVQDLLLPARHVHGLLLDEKVGENQAKVNRWRGATGGDVLAERAWSAASAAGPAGRRRAAPADAGAVRGGCGAGLAAGIRRAHVRGRGPTAGTTGSRRPPPPPSPTSRGCRRPPGLLRAGLGLARPRLRLPGARLGLADAQRRPRASRAPTPPSAARSRTRASCSAGVTQRPSNST